MLETSLKAMLTALPLVAELHHPAMRPRHWQQLMKVRPSPTPLPSLIIIPPTESLCSCLMPYAGLQ